MNSSIRRILMSTLVMMSLVSIARAQSLDFWRPMLHGEAILDTISARAVHFSSYDPGGGNSDMGHYYGTDRGWHILADFRGPGVIGDIWLTGHNVADTSRIRIFVDDSVTALIDTTVKGFFGHFRMFVPPLADTGAGAWFSYVPIPFQSMARVTYWGDAIYDHVTALSYPAGTTISSLTLPPAAEYLAKVDSLSHRMQNPDDPAWVEQPFVSVTDTATIDTFSSAEVISYSGRGGCRKIYLRIPEHTQAVLENVWVRILTDASSRPDFEGPLSAVFGLAQGWHPYRSVCNGVVGDSLYLNLPIAFESHFRIELVNRTAVAQSVTVIAEIAQLPPDGLPVQKAVGIYHEENSNQAWRGFEVADVTGPGTYLGCALDMQVHNSQCYEGDEHMWIDDEATPSWKGTGTEDYFNAAYYWNAGTSCVAFGFHGCVNWWWQWAAAYRWHVTDPISFRSHFRLNFDVGPWNDLSGHYRSMAFFAVPRHQWQLLDTDRNQRSFPAESLFVIGQGQIPGSSLLRVTMGGTELVRLDGDSVTGPDSVVSVAVAAPGGMLNGPQPVVAEMSTGNVTLATAWDHHRMPDFSYTQDRADPDSFVYVGDTMTFRAQGLVPGATMDILAGALTFAWAGDPPTADTWGNLQGHAIVPAQMPFGDRPITIVSLDRPFVTSSVLMRMRPYVRMEIENLQEDYYHGDDRISYAPDFLPTGVNEHWGRNLTRYVQARNQDDTTGYCRLSFWMPDSGTFRTMYFFGKTGGGAKIRVTIDSTSVDVPEYDSYFATPGLWRWTRSDTVRGTWHQFSTGWHTVRFDIVGRNPASDGWKMILDQMFIRHDMAEFLPAPKSVKKLTCRGIPTGIRLIWSKVRQDTTGATITPDNYVIYRRTNYDSVFTVIARTRGTDSSFIDTASTLPKDVVVWYYVTASRGPVGIVSPPDVTPETVGVTVTPPLEKAKKKSAARARVSD